MYFRYCLVELGVPAAKMTLKAFDMSCLEEIPMDKSNKVLVRKKQKNIANGTLKVQSPEGMRIMKLSGKFTFVNYVQVLARMIKILNRSAEDQEVGNM